MNGSVTNSVKPGTPFSSLARCMAARVRRWPSQCRGWSTCPYIIVEEERSPSSCAVETTSIQVAAGSLPLVSTHRTSSSRISAAVPGIESSPASLAAVSQSRTDMPVRVAPLTTSIGENACTWMPGTRSFTARAMSKYAVPGRSGWMPPCMHTSTAPTSQACAARSATWSRERV